jgi:hypothetical protein
VPMEPVLYVGSIGPVTVRVVQFLTYISFVRGPGGGGCFAKVNEPVGEAVSTAVVHI